MTTPDRTVAAPLVMPPNMIDHFYRGGEHIAELRGVDMPSPRRAGRVAGGDHCTGRSRPGVGPSRTSRWRPAAGLDGGRPDRLVGERAKVPGRR